MFYMRKRSIYECTHPCPEMVEFFGGEVWVVADGIGVPRNLIVLASGEINMHGVEKDAWGGKCFIGTRDWQKMAFCGELLSNSLGYSWKNERSSEFSWRWMKAVEWGMGTGLIFVRGWCPSIINHATCLFSFVFFFQEWILKVFFIVIFGELEVGIHCFYQPIKKIWSVFAVIFQ
jgi:hypothetical protein